MFHRYRVTHEDRLRGFALKGHDRRVVGHVERVRIADGQIVLSGWAAGVALELRWTGGVATVARWGARADVAQLGRGPLTSGFDLRAPVGARNLVLHGHVDGGPPLAVAVPDPTAPLRLRATLRLVRMFVRDGLRAMPAIVGWMRQGGWVHRAAVKRAFGLGPVAERQRLIPGHFAPATPHRGRRAITIVVPVFDAVDLTRACLERVARHTDLPWRMTLVDDASPDPRIRPMLDQFAARHPKQVIRLSNPRNLGFVGTVNRALAHAVSLGQTVVLLNSDALVPDRWASRLVAPLERDPTIASATPLSNRAEILSVPILCPDRRPDRRMMTQIDDVAQACAAANCWPEIPTGIGFCMALSADWLRRKPRFDSAFAPGYGEEVDWCQAIAALGGRHVAVPGLCVEHVGHASFGAEQRARLVARSNDMLSRRYPTFGAAVQTYMACDPLLGLKMALLFAQAAVSASRTVPMFLGHALGGGAEDALRAEIADAVRVGGLAVVLRVGAADARWQVEVHWAGGTLTATAEEITTVARLLAPIPSLHVIYSCGVGDADPASLPAALLSLLRPDRGDRLSARLHDFFMISPSYCLLDHTLRFRGAGRAAVSGPAHQARSMSGQVVPIAQWQSTWRRFLQRCDEVVVFSDSSQRLLLEAYPELRARVVRRPHRLPVPVAHVCRSHARPTVVGVLGNLNRQKGAGIVARFAARAAVDRRARVVVLGACDPMVSLPPCVLVHGGYDRSDISELTARYGIGAWLSPSIWPETFSFTTHEMLATGLPVFGFALGGQGDALRAAPNGHAVACDPADLSGDALFDAWAHRLGRNAHQACPPPATRWCAKA